ncbi:MAG TPA: pyridoxal-dependent decarboxylase [Dongiaceae bacterium]|nr:pyridoxal-dependent decarboxylase [Dongiaceae bacterium]
MSALDISDRDLARVLDEAATLAKRYWASLEARRAFPVTNGAETQRLFERAWAEEGLGAAVLGDFETIAAHSRPSNGKFFAYVAGSGEPVGAVGDLLASVLNQNATSWRSAPAAISIERAVIGWLAEAVGCGGFAGSLCGGGSSANLMALAMAREAKAPANESGIRPCVVYASTEVHMAVPKAIALLGIGRDNLRLIPVDADLRMRVDALEAAIVADRKAGRLPIAIVASAGTVNIGAVDPLREIADIARREALWFHVDGAYGGFAAIAAPEKFAGLDRADSLALDAHKWLYQPIDCGCLLYRDRRPARAAFSASGDYVKVMTEDPVESFAVFDESMELSRRFRALKLWLSLQYHGRRAFRATIAADLGHAQLLAREIAAASALELVAPVPLSAVCFRHRTKDNAAILKRVIARGRVYISNATIGGAFVLRACFVNHRATEDDVRAIVSEVLAAADELNA